MKCSSKIEKVQSDIRGPLYVEAMKMEAAGERVLKINSGNLAIFGHEAPASVKAAIIDGIDKAVPYCDFRGMPAARRAICDYYKGFGCEDIVPDDIYLGNGVSELADIALSVLLEDGDEILVPNPCYSLWSNCAKKVGATPVHYVCDEESDWYPDIADIERKVTPKTKAIVVINPNNPTGALYPDDILIKIADIARKNNLVILSDEIYDRLIYGDVKFSPMATIAPDLFVITLNGLSKSHVVCGYRAGWMLISGKREDSRDFRSGVDKLTSLRLCAGAIPQLIIPAALADGDSVKARFVPGGQIYERRRATIEAINSTESLSCKPNAAGLYVFPKINAKYKITDDRVFARELLVQKKILLVPGSGFDYPTPDHFRIVMLPSEDELASAIKSIDELLNETFL